MTLSSAPEPTGMALALGIERTAWSPGHTCLEVTVTPDHLNKGGAAHGGLMTVLLDAALGGALVSTLPVTSWCATTQLTTSFWPLLALGNAWSPPEGWYAVGATWPTWPATCGLENVWWPPRLARGPFGMNGRLRCR